MEFTIVTRVRRRGERDFEAAALAIPRGVCERCAPEERTARLPCRTDAERALVRLSQKLAQDIVARGNEVAAPEAAHA